MPPRRTAHQPGAVGSLRPLKPAEACKTVPRRARGLDGQTRRGAQELRQALALWRGRPLADVAGLAWLEGQAGRLDLLCQQIRRALSWPVRAFKSARLTPACAAAIRRPSRGPPLHSMHSYPSRLGRWNMTWQ
jgi:hypothetical protein